MSEMYVEEEQPRILVIDDSKEACRVLISLLTDEGFQVVAVNEGAQALEEIIASPPDLVLLDVMMPGMDGLEVLQAIRSHPPTAELPVIMVTALDSTHDVVQGFDLGATDYLTKPIQFEVLLARVRTHINIKRLQDQRLRDIERLRELDALKDKFIRIAAHDLKNPLNNLTMGVELIASPDSQRNVEEYERIVDLMRAAVATMRAIIDDFLDLQALQAGQFELHPRLTSLNTVVEEVTFQQTAYAESKSITVASELAPGLPSCMADANRLAQVLGNLIGNAIKFSPLGTVVTVRTRKRNGMIRFEVEDQGPGIPENEMPLLFQAFARLSNQPTSGEKSSGLGLSIARQLIEAHGGEIGAESRVGEGSLFWFEIPPGDGQDGPSQ